MLIYQELNSQWLNQIEINVAGNIYDLQERKSRNEKCYYYELNKCNLSAQHHQEK